MTTAVEEKRAGIVGPTVVRSKDGSALVRARESKSQQSTQTTLFGFFDKENGINWKTTFRVSGKQFYSPRHKHTFDQVRYFVRGSVQYGKDVYEAGTCLYLPEGVHYGPMQPIEGMERAGIGMQFAGCSRIMFPYRSDIAKAREAMEKLGTNEKGAFRWADGRLQDGYEAVLEHLTGRKVEYPKPRYDNYIVMHSENHAWTPLKGASGVFVKHLGYFNATGPNIKLLKIEPGAETSAGMAAFQQVRAVVEGEIDYEGENYETVSCMYLPAHVPYSSIKSARGATLLVVQLAANPDEPPPFCLI